MDDQFTKSIYVFFFNDTATTEIYTLSLHDASSDLQRGEGILDLACGGSLHDRDLQSPGAGEILSDCDGPLGTCIVRVDRKSTRLNSSTPISRMPSSA